MDTWTFIKALGGPTAVAKVLGLRMTAVSNWTMRDAIATEHHLAVWRLASARNVAWTPPGAEGLVLVKASPRQQSEREVLDGFRSTDEQGRDMILRLVRSLNSAAPRQRVAAE